MVNFVMDELLLKCLVEIPQNLSTSSSLPNSDSVQVANNQFGLGTMTGISIVLLLDVLSVEINKQRAISLKNIFLRLFNVNTLSRSLVLSILLMTLPLTSVFLLTASFYKLFCGYLIMKKDKNYVGFLDSFDVFWSLEDDATNSIINVLGVIESDSPQNLVQNIKEKLQSILQNEDTQKIFYRRNEAYGFYYWRKFNFVEIDEYVQIIDLTGKDNLNVDDLENLITDVQYQSLPYNDEGLFKILVTKQRVGNIGEDKGEYGIIFRIHHSVGDGVALIEFLCQRFADKSGTRTVNMLTSPVKTNKKCPYAILNMMQKLCEMPLCFVDGILRKPDQNSLHGPTLSGHKIFKWTEWTSDETLLTMVKEIKENVEQLNFTDILLAALSNGLQIYFSKTLAHIPEDVAVVLPVRFPKPLANDNGPLLENDFSVTILDLPMKTDENLKGVKDRCNKLRLSADHLTNYYFLKLISSILPKSILQPMLNSSQATMVFSNLPGPDRISICGGNYLKNLVFFVPNKGTTGLGVTALCYGGVLRFAAMADTSIMPNREHLALILEGMVEEIKRLHKQFVP